MLDRLVAVVGDHFWSGEARSRALKISWNEGSNAAVDQAQVWKQAEAAESNPRVPWPNQSAMPTRAWSQGERVDAEYRLPFLAHAPMEPINCTVHVRPDGCEIWVGTQVNGRTQAIAARSVHCHSRKSLFITTCSVGLRAQARSRRHREGRAHRTARQTDP